MRLISKKQLRDYVIYTPQHIQRLENAGKFPKRVRLGANRVSAPGHGDPVFRCMATHRSN